jgi:hypothetical protein
MGTKTNPGQFDCYAAAADDEQMFVLLGRDKHAPTLVRLWALLRAYDGEDEAKISEAIACADAMERHAAALGKRQWLSSTMQIALLYAASSRLSEHPENYEHACLCAECCSYS